MGKEFYTVKDLVTRGIVTTRTTLYRHMGQGLFPRPDFRYGHGRPGWSNELVQTAVEAGRERAAKHPN